MIISFFEEFPNKNSLDKLKLVRFPTKLYIAAKSLKEFNKIKSKIKNRHVKEFIYWPILEIKEGYWFSPFSDRKALLRVFNELKGKNIPVMIDAELHFTKDKSPFLTQLFNFFRNRRLIRNFIRKYPRIYVAEYYPRGRIKDAVLSFLGLHFNPDKYDANIIKMIYHSMLSFNEGFITNKLRVNKEKFGDRFLVGFGTIAAGILGNEPKLSYSQLEKDLQIAKKTGLKEAVIFRLGGLNKSYALILEKYS